MHENLKANLPDKRELFIYKSVLKSKIAHD